MIGKTLAHYQILEKLGEGGMGVVYKARDTHLDRLVAVKVLPPDKVADPERKRRFVQEAKAASALNHPNIITIHDIASENGIHFIVMEYVQGKTLDALIPRKGLRLNETLKFAIQMADALAKAHSAGIVHRDLKPSNVMVTDDGRVKILDFGLAKLTEFSDSGDERTLQSQTEEGTIVGTVSYMSPEQAEGKKVDVRSDIFSFGSVLYEMATGQQPFHGESKMSTLAAILNQEPKPVSQLVPGIPRDLEKIITRCLRKDPNRRFQIMSDLRVTLEELNEESDSGMLVVTPASRRSRRLVLAMVAVFITVLLVVGFSAWFFGIRSRKPEVSLTAVPLTTYPGHELYPTFSPDGNQVAFCWNGEKQDNFDIYVKLIGPGEPLRLTRDPAQDYSPAWSPDGRSIAFLRFQPGADPAVFLVPALGGAERKLSLMHLPPQMDLPVGASRDLAWSPDSKWLAFPDAKSDNEQRGIFLLSVETGEKRRLTHPPANCIDANPAFAPDGRALAFIRSSGIGMAISEIFLIGLPEKMISKGEPRQLTFETQTILCPAWTSNGQELLFSLGKLFRPNLWRVPAVGSVKPQRLASVGEEGFLPSISREGHRLTYVRGFSDWNIWRLELSGLSDKQDPVANLIHSTQMEFEPQYSPDGKKIAFVSNRLGNNEIWACNSDGTNPIQITSLGGPHNGAPRWSPDGNQITFDSYVVGPPEVYIVSAEGGKAKRLTENPSDDFYSGWSRDGNWVYFTSKRSGVDQIWKMPANGGEAVQVTKKGGVVPCESPDGKWLYYTKQAGTRAELWKLALEDDKEKQVLDNFAGGTNFTLGTQGIYFISALQPNGETDLQFLSFSDSKIKTIGHIKNPVVSLTVSPDGRSLLYDKADQQGSDLMLVENFR
jgi:serine/threonine protein kinase/Tol biopolymer transport system component